MKVNNHASNLPEWLDAFTSVASSAFGFNKEASVERTAEQVVNPVDPLPKTVDQLDEFEWKNEHFKYKQVDGAGIVYNSYGNTVMTIDGATSVQDAINAFNGDRVDANQEIEVEDDDSVELIDDVLDETEIKEASNDYGFKELRADIQSLKRTVEALSAQQYARQEIPNNIYDLNCQEQEVAHFNETANNTQTVINAEHALDMSTQIGRGQLNYEFLKGLFPDNPALQQSIIDNIETQLVENNSTELADDVPQIEETSVVENTVPEQDEIEIVKETVEEMPAEQVGTSETDNWVILDDPDDLQMVQEDHKCPFCGEDLELDNYTEGDEFSMIHCTSCNKQYKVDLNTGNIFYINSEDDTNE